ncbi:hypothetical protein SFR_6958 (plasmid) [Streptomyces sp. FR-008]|nr:hypothetical protein SFR_6958 [Streptomyces sp. FR-008]
MTAAPSNGPRRPGTPPPDEVDAAAAAVPPDLLGMIEQFGGLGDEVVAAGLGLPAQQARSRVLQYRLGR